MLALLFIFTFILKRAIMYNFHSFMQATLGCFCHCILVFPVLSKFVACILDNLKAPFTITFPCKVEHHHCIFFFPYCMRCTDEYCSVREFRHPVNFVGAL